MPAHSWIEARGLLPRRIGRIREFHCHLCLLANCCHWPLGVSGQVCKKSSIGHLIEPDMILHVAFVEEILTTQIREHMFGRMLGLVHIPSVMWFTGFHEHSYTYTLLAFCGSVVVRSHSTGFHLSPKYAHRWNHCCLCGVFHRCSLGRSRWIGWHEQGITKKTMRKTVVTIRRDRDKTGMQDNSCKIHSLNACKFWRVSLIYC